LAKKIGRKATHALSLVLGGLGLISYYFISDPNYLLLSMTGVGIAWASILSMPYAILTDSLPSNKMGYYMGVFNFFIVIPQLVAASILGFLVVKYFNGEAIFAIITGGVSMIVAAVSVLFVSDKNDFSS
jgi:maltose/moltooligosaccharide transporter